MRHVLLFVCVFLLSCGTQACGTKDKDPVFPLGLFTGLAENINTIEPKLAYCDGLPVEAGNNGTTGRENCNSGDSILWSGLFLSAHRSASIEAGVRASIREDGKPFRSPEHLKAGDAKDSFSRDQYMGLLLYSVATKDSSVLLKVWNYAKANRYNLCDDSDGRCRLTSNMLALTGDVFSYLGVSRPNETNIRRELDEAAIFLEASTVPRGYALHLVSVNVYLRVLTGNLSAGYAKSVKKVFDRDPTNIWFAYLYNLTSTGNKTEYERIAAVLEEKMALWPQGDKTQWSFQRTDWPVTVGDSMGHELVMLAYLLGQGNTK